MAGSLFLAVWIPACSGGDDAKCGDTTYTDTPSPDATDDTDTVAATDDGPPSDPADLTAATPVVVHTVPALGDGAVDPSTTEIVVTFSVDMDPGGWSFVTVNDLGPEFGSTQWLDDRTIRTQVVLVPDATYEVWLNDPFGNFTSFVSADGRTAGPYGLVFATSAE